MKKITFIIAFLFIAVALFAPVSLAYHIKGTDKDIEARDTRISGKNYLLLVDICEANGIDWEWDSISRRMILRKNGHEAVLLIGSEYYCVDADIKKAGDPVEIKDGSIYVPLKFAKYTIPYLFSLKEKKEKESKVTGTAIIVAPDIQKPSGKKFKVTKIVLDPGHGGKDPGAISRSGIREKDIVLDAARRLKKALEKEGVDVIMTRSSDIFVPLEMRARIANRANADFFISIHANASRSRWIKGFEVYYLSEATDDNARAMAVSENSALDYEESSLDRHSKNVDAIVWDLQLTEHREVSIELAGFICQEVTRILRRSNSSIKSARFYVLKGAEMPSVLVELSYLSNRTEERKLKDSSYRQKLAEGIAAGIVRYKDEYERTNGFSQ
ncbi:MAG: N-acetylmuramoyl-L-alanine amidase [Candidatus Omnitrophica bacterium]|nr:N-acetylmuramoyl-L-alanine amidase [Candidatus Omnitrophota bacterium]MBU4487686.1 N-acetylmuramoyl-L-alanine amidase [Candidatus Omnitrophota bacterium]MCG2704813.1 N-acetylmuramoyl-L-alanine amidase [Candidatus Omnitrophota bacterium]